MKKLAGPTKLIKQRYDICIFNKRTSDVILYKKSNFRYWFADPFLVCENNDLFCFVELMDNHVKHGQIGVIDSKGNFKVVISENYHLSFPNIFKHDGKWFMMPESAANHDLHLYVSEDFPYKWRKYKTLLENVTLCDSIFFKFDSEDYLLAYDFSKNIYRILIYRFDMSKMTVGELVADIPDSQKLLRPAGKAFYNSGFLILPTQKGTNSYGEDVLFNKITKTEHGNFEITPTSYTANYPVKITKKYDHKHTYNSYNDFAVLDFSKLVFSLIQILDGLPYSLKTSLRKIK